MSQAAARMTTVERALRRWQYTGNGTYRQVDEDDEDAFGLTHRHLPDHNAPMA